MVAVMVTIRREKALELKRKVDEFLAKNVVDRGTIRELAGPCSWIGSIVPVLKPYTQMLWAAACAPPAEGESSVKMARARVSLPLRWLRAFAEKDLIRLPRRFPVVCPKKGPVIAFDASLSGGGAVIYLPTRDTRYLTTAWTSHDHEALGAVRGDPAFQAAWEAFALLTAVYTWQTSGWSTYHAWRRARCSPSSGGTTRSQPALESYCGRDPAGGRSDG